MRRVRLEIFGIVQGVGFRPFVHARATAAGLGGFVGNDAGGVFVEVEGPAGLIDEFVEELVRRPPPLAVVDEVTIAEIDPVGTTTTGTATADEHGFSIRASDDHGVRNAQVSPDVGPCDDCLAELDDPGDRRYRYPFLNCTNCGPRFSIVRDVPYDRPRTTMSDFVMCGDCRREYEDPTDRRFHAQPVCCPACGPRLSLVDAAGDEVDADALAGTVQLLVDGGIVAIKGIGGFHLAVDARSEIAVARLRARKHREDKPFAVLVEDLAAARALCDLDDREAALLAGPERSIVLVRRHGGADVAGSVAPGNRFLGLMLPSSPLHVLVVRALGGPLVLTSGNRSSEPIAFRDDDAFAALGGIADAFCTHNRPIHVRIDDSVVRVVADRALPLRRARGYTPRAVRLPWGLARPVLGCGAQLKSTVCVARADHAYLSQHLGDLDDASTFAAFTEAVEHLGRLFGIVPEVVAHDLHPDMASTRFAESLDDVELVGVQHHHAHIASCLVDNDTDRPVIGVAFDGLGLGDDGTAWGGEVLVADLVDYERVGHLAAVPMPGGDRATGEPWRMAAAHLGDQLASDRLERLGVYRRNRDRWGPIQQMVSTGFQAPSTTSMGRLFDAVAALVDVRDAVTYEGQAAIELEQRADPGETGTYEVTVDDGGPFVMHGRDLVLAAAADLDAGVPVAHIAARFHNSVAALVVACCERVRASHGLAAVALSGGVFQNALLLDRIVPALRDGGFEVLTHRRVPPNDGGISLGQVAVAGARDRARPS